MNIYLSLAIFFAFMFCIFAIQSINYYIAKCRVDSDDKIKTKLNPYAPFICALLSSIFFGMCF